MPAWCVVFGGICKVLMVVCLVTVLVVAVRQTARHYLLGDLPLPSNPGMLPLLKVVLFAAFVVVTLAGVALFRKTPYKSGGPGYLSHDKNQPCILLAFDS